MTELNVCPPPPQLSYPSTPPPPLLFPLLLPSLTPPPSLPQVGTKERKVAPYGGSFSNKGDKAYLTRPGVRVWTADRNGKVSFVLSLMMMSCTMHALLPNLPTGAMHSKVP